MVGVKKWQFEEYDAMVDSLFKQPHEINKTLTNDKLNLMHCVFGISGEAGELLDSIKKHLVYNKELDVDNIIEEMGDIEFYLSALRIHLGITRRTVLEANVEKLNKRYAEGYSDQAAQDRKDKLEQYIKNQEYLLDQKAAMEIKP